MTNWSSSRGIFWTTYDSKVCSFFVLSLLALESAVSQVAAAHEHSCQHDQPVCRGLSQVMKSSA